MVVRPDVATGTPGGVWPMLTSSDDVTSSNQDIAVSAMRQCEAWLQGRNGSDGRRARLLQATRWRVAHVDRHVVASSNSRYCG
jgi:hypothetical protein